MIGIYKFTNKYDRKVYIGKSKDIERRYIVHKKDSLKTNGKTHWIRALQKYGIDSFDFEVLIELPWLEGLNKGDVKKILDYWERFYIKYYCAKNPDYGYNMTNGGDGISFWDEELRQKHSVILSGRPSTFKGKHHTEETKKYLSEINTGKKQSQETIEKRRQKLLGHKTSEETKEKIRQAEIGKPLSQERRNKISNSLKGHEPWNKGKHGYKIKKSGKRTPEQCKNISDGIKRAKLLKENKCQVS